MTFNPEDLKDFDKAVELVEKHGDDFRAWYSDMCQNPDFCTGLRVGIVFMIACQNSLLSGEGEADMEDAARVMVKELESNSGDLPEFLLDDEND